MSKQKVYTFLGEEGVEVLDSVVDNSKEKADMWDMSRSEALREFFKVAVDHLGENPALEELVDDLDLKRYRDQQRHEQRRKLAEYADMAGGWRGRVSQYLSKRLAGPEPHPPDKIEILCESYFGDIQDREIDPETLEPNEDKIEDHRKWLNLQKQLYREAYEQKQLVPKEAFDHVDRVETGADLGRLKDSFGELLGEIHQIALGDANDPDAIYRKLAADYAVAEGTIQLVVEELTGEEVDARRALRSGDGILDAVDRPTLEAWGGDPEALDRAAATDQDGPATDQGAVEVDQPVDADQGAEQSEPVETEEPTTRRGSHSDTVGDFTAEDLAPDHLIETAEKLLREGEEPHMVEKDLKGERGTESQRRFALEAAQNRLSDTVSEEAEEPHSGRVLTAGGETDE